MSVHTLEAVSRVVSVSCLRVAQPLPPPGGHGNPTEVVCEIVDKHEMIKAAVAQKNKAMALAQMNELKLILENSKANRVLPIVSHEEVVFMITQITAQTVNENKPCGNLKPFVDFMQTIVDALRANPMFGLALLLHRTK